MTEQDERLVAAFGGGVLHERHGLPLARFAGDEKLDVVLLERFDLLFRTRGSWEECELGNGHGRVADDADGTCPGAGLQRSGNLAHVVGGSANKCGFALF